MPLGRARTAGADRPAPAVEPGQARNAASDRGRLWRFDWTSPARQRWRNACRPDSLVGRLARNTGWCMLANLASRVGLLAAMLLVSRLLGAVTYGELGIVQNTTAMFGILAGFGMGLTATKHIAELRLSDPAKAGRVLRLTGFTTTAASVLMALCLIVIAPWLAAYPLAAGGLTAPLRIGALWLVGTAINSYQSAALAGFQSYRIQAILNGTSGVLAVPMVLGGAHFGGLNGALWGLTANSAFACLIYHAALRHEARQHGMQVPFLECFRERQLLWTFGIPSALSGALVMPVNWITAAMLVNQPAGYLEMGIYNAANQWFSALTFLPTVLGQVFLPMMSARKSSDGASPGKLLLLSVALNGIAVLPLVLISLCSWRLILGVSGEDFLRSPEPLIIQLVTAGLVAMLMPIGHFIAATGRMWYGLAMNFGWAVVFVIGTVPLVAYGASGVASARFIAYVFHAVWMIAFARCMLAQSRLESAHDAVENTAV